MDSADCGYDGSLLPENVITDILQHLEIADLKNASIVCRSWYAASTDPKIARHLVLTIRKAEDIPRICELNRKYGVLKLHDTIDFGQIDINYSQLFETYGQFLYRLEISIGRSQDKNIKLRQLLKLLECSECLKVCTFVGKSNSFTEQPRFFPFDYDTDSRTRIIKNLAGISSVTVDWMQNISFIADFLQYTTNLKTFRLCNQRDSYTNDELFTLFENPNVSHLKHLDMNITISGTADDFITRFVNIEKLRLKSLVIKINWDWTGGVCNNLLLFSQFILKLESLEELLIGAIGPKQLTIICQCLTHLKILKCYLSGANHAVSELGKLTQLQKLLCDFPNVYLGLPINAEIDNFFQHKFENLRELDFDAPVTEPQLEKFCENHPDLIELNLRCLLTRNLEIIFQHLTELRICKIRFGGPRCTGSGRDYTYKISRLQNLEEFHLDEQVSGISKDDVLQLKKLRKSTNIPK